MTSSILCFIGNKWVKLVKEWGASQQHDKTFINWIVDGSSKRNKRNTICAFYFFHLPTADFLHCFTILKIECNSSKVNCWLKKYESTVEKCNKIKHMYSKLWILLVSQLLISKLKAITVLYFLKWTPLTLEVKIRTT